MTRPNQPVARQDLAAPLTWLLSLSAALLMVAADVLPLEIPALRPEGVHATFLRAELFSLLFLWPLFGTASDPRSRSVWWQLAVLLVLAAPLSFMAAAISGVGPDAWLQGRLLVAAVALLPAAFLALPDAAVRASTYYLLVFLAALGLPYMAFATGWDWPAQLGSAFRAVAAIPRTGWAAELAPCLLAHLVAAGLLLAAARRRCTPTGAVSPKA